MLTQSSMLNEEKIGIHGDATSKKNPNGGERNYRRKVGQQSRGWQTNGPEHTSYLSPFVTTLNSFGLLVKQGLVTMPSRPSNKIFILFLLFYVFIITTVYGSNLTAFLTITRQPPGVETFKELYESKLDLYALGPFPKSVLANSENSYHRALADRCYIMAFPEIRKQVLSGKGVMINGRGYLEFARDQLATAKGRPRARLVKECFAPFSVATAFQIYSPLRDRFSEVLEDCWKRVYSGGGTWRTSGFIRSSSSVTSKKASFSRKTSTTNTSPPTA
ncbi:uncharacterized protein LOC135211825 [Macrobrachium nipponense]|uniref:uncharacterized protein LOC135211825 n=1 Tax=Macrobrachium nipponense TaxID=159736 RepID=UPI0030C7D9B2